MAATPLLPSPLATTSTPTLSSYEQPKPSRSQLVQMPRRPSHRTLRARQVTHVLAVRFCGRGEVLMLDIGCGYAPQLRLLLVLLCRFVVAVLAGLSGIVDGSGAHPLLCPG
jgi:hypothetical protein